jgi:hypothetical protein
MAKKNASKNKNASRPAGESAALTNVSDVRVRMYRQGLGDCFLLSFASGSDFGSASHVLIDCGTLGATTTGVKMKDVVSNIAQTTKSQLTLLMATHEHQDHLSGFNSEREAFDAMSVGHSWVAWTENPADPLARKLEKYKGDLGVAALAASDALSQSRSSVSGVRAMAAGMKEVLSFVGNPVLGANFAKGVDQAMKYVASRASAENREYLKPGTYLQPRWLPGVTVYVLGPPHDEKKIKNMGKHGNPELYELSGSSVTGFGASAKWFADNGSWKKHCELLSAQDRDQLDRTLPFDQRYRLRAIDTDRRLATYNSAANTWRRVDMDWLLSSADLALQLDNLTNNTSLALAFEVGENGPVILMAADAQLGNWLSWHDYTWELPGNNGSARKLQAKDLLARTIIYKVGHHSSHNATAVQHGLEMMTDCSLVALIPLDKKVAVKKKWPMPAAKLYARLLEKAKGRVLRSDIGWPANSERPDSVSTAEWKKLPSRLQIAVEDEYVDVLLTTRLDKR